MSFLRICIIIVSVVTIVSCNRSAEYEKRARTLDSLGGALNNLAAGLLKQDTLKLQKYLTQYGYYSVFIETSRFDTLSKTSADHLQKFYHSGNGLRAFVENRYTLLARIALLNSQYKRLSEDIRNHAISVELVDAFVEQEKKEANRVLDLGYQQQQQIFHWFEQYSVSAKEVEQIIMKYNNGQLPTIIKDSTPQF